MNATRKVKLKDITTNLRCRLCLGYLVDATTIIECLHSFCKSCIVKYLEKSADLEEKYCPVCDVQLHSTKPLTSIRSDLMLQEIVYKLVPGLFKDEMNRRRKFYAANDDAAPNNQLDSGQVFDELYITSDDIIHLSLEYLTDDLTLKDTTRRFLKCPAAVSVFILKKLIQGKYDLDAGAEIDIMFGDRILPDDFLLMDVAYKYSWTMNGSKPLTLSYRIKGLTKPVLRYEKAINDTTATHAPEVQEISKSKCQDEAQNMKKVCNENGSNIMPFQEIKSITTKLPGNGIISEEGSAAPTKTPTGKVKMRSRKLISYPESDGSIERKEKTKNLSKRRKLEQDKVTQSNYLLPSQTEAAPTKDNNSKNPSTKEVKEVQLQISENGVMSARSVSSGEEKIILNIATSSSASNSTPSPTMSHMNLHEKLLLSTGSFHSKTGGITEIICDKSDTSINTINSMPAKPGYVTLNIPNPINPMLPQNTNSFRNSLNGNSNNTNMFNHETKSTSTSLTTSTPNGKSPLGRKATVKSHLFQKLQNRMKANGKDGDNVIKAITDLGKLNLCNNSSAELGSSITDGQRSVGVGVHSFTNQAAQHHRSKPVNGTPKPSGSNNNDFTLPLALNFSPASGMSVSMIPCGSTLQTSSANNCMTTSSSITISPSQVTPPKRVSHQATGVNGDLRFSSSRSPKFILPKSADMNGSSPKKPPKFFKSRHTTSPESLAHFQQGSPSHRPDSGEPKRKTPVHMMKGKEYADKKTTLRNESPKSNSTSIISSSNCPSTTVNAGQHSQSMGTSTVSSSQNGIMSNGVPISRPLTYPSVATDKLSQHLNALNNLTMGSGDPLSASFGLAAAASVAAAMSAGNGALGMVPFITDSYCSMPFLNQRAATPQASFPFGFPILGYQNQNPKGVPSNPSTQLTSLLTSMHKPGTGLPSPGKHSQGPSESSKTLDLSVGKGSNDDASVSAKKSHHAHKSPLLISLLNGKNELSDGNKSEAKLEEQEKRKTNGSEEANKTQYSTFFEGKPNECDDEKQAKMMSTSSTNDTSETRSNNNRAEVSKICFPEIPAADSNKSKLEGKACAKEGNITETNFTRTSSTGNNNVFEQVKLLSLCLSAQNNNDHTMSNNHEKTDEDASTSSSILRKTLNCANTITNGKNNNSPVVPELASKTGSA